MIFAFLLGAFVVLLLITGFDNSDWIAVAIGALLGLASLLLEKDD